MRRKTSIGIGVALVVAALSTGLFVFYKQPSQFIYYTLTTILLVASLIWIGNSFITKQLNNILPWLQYGKKRFFIQLLIGIIFSMGVINLAYYLVKTLLTELPPTLEQYIVTNVYGFVFFVPSYAIYYSLRFLSQWQESELEVARFQQESMRSQLASLKNHLDPHFLFNNLNILSSLIEKDIPQSQRFLGTFAEVYRTMLLIKVEDLITIKEEMDFIHAYMYLIHMRFEENIQLSYELDGADMEYLIPPLTIQMLVENAIKHNNIRIGDPLKIRIFREENWLIVENNLNEKPQEPHTRSGTGLQNIRERYKYYTEETLFLDRSNGKFIAKLPLLEIESL